MSVLMADSTRPWLIPGHIRYALVYGNGLYAWTDDQIDRFRGHVVIGVHPGDPHQAHYCRELDVERFDANPADAGPFLRERRSLGHHDGTIYCDRSNMDAVWQSAREAGLSTLRWHVATLDGTKWVDVPGGHLWAVQFETVELAYDLSVVYGPLDFTHG